MLYEVITWVRRRGGTGKTGDRAGTRPRTLSAPVLELAVLPLETVQFAPDIERGTRLAHLLTMGQLQAPPHHPLEETFDLLVIFEDQPGYRHRFAGLLVDRLV